MRTDKAKLAFIAALGFTACSLPAFAAVNVPSTADPARVQQQIAPPPIVEAAPEVKTAAPAMMPVQAPPGADKISFVLADVQIEGMTVYKQDDVAPLLKPLLNQKISLADIYTLANALTTKYRNDGYILSQVIVPPQHIKDGRIVLRAVEGYIDEVHIQNKSDKKEPTYYSGYGDMIKASRPLNEKVLEKYMLILNDLPGVTAKSVLSPSSYAPGASDLTITLEHKIADASAETDNRGSKYIGPQQYNASTRLNNVFGANEAISLQGTSAPGNLKSYAFSFTKPLGYMGTTVNISAGTTFTKPGYTLSQFDIKGLTHDYSASITHPLIRSRNENLSVTFKLEYFNSDRTDNLSDPVINDRERIARLSLQFEKADNYQGINTVSAEVSNGINGFHASQRGDANMSQAEGDPQFVKVTAEATRTQALPHNTEIYAAVTGQKSADSLLSSEQFGIGGASYGSAYDSSEITGKDGIAFRTEFRANPVLEHIQHLQPYAFYDIGKVWNPQSTDPSLRIVSLADVGLGLRAIINNNLSGSFEYAKPLTKPVSADNSKSGRWFYMLTAKF